MALLNATDDRLENGQDEITKMAVFHADYSNLCLIICSIHVVFYEYIMVHSSVAACCSPNGRFHVMYCYVPESNAAETFNRILALVICALHCTVEIIQQDCYVWQSWVYIVVYHVALFQDYSNWVLHAPCNTDTRERTIYVSTLQLASTSSLVFTLTYR